MKYLFLSMALVAAFFAFDSGQSDTVRWISGGLCLFLAAVDVWLCLKGKKRPAPVRQQSAAQPVAPSLDLGGDWELETFPGLQPATPAPATVAPATTEKKHGGGWWTFFQIIIAILALADIVVAHGWFGVWWLAPLLIIVTQGAKNNIQVSKQFLISGGPIFSGSIKLLWAGVWVVTTVSKILGR